jgi:hypothetical protein
MTSPPRAKPSRPVLVLVLISALVSVFACTKHDALVLLDLRGSGPLGAPVVRVRLSAPGWKTRVITGTIGPEGFRVGYYGPADGGAVSVTAEALDGVDCVLGNGSATVPALASGATSDPTTLFIRPLPASGCGVVGGNDAGTDDAGDADTGGGEDAGGEDVGPVDAASDAGGEGTSSETTPDAGPDGSADAAGADANDAGAADAGD